VTQHVLTTGNGTCLADRWPDPRALVTRCGSNYALSGDPAALAPGDLRAAGIAGFVDAPAPFVPLLRAALDDVKEWERVILALDGPPAAPSTAGPAPRRLGPADEGALAALSVESSWIGNTWGGPAGLAARAVAWGAFAGGRLVSVAVPFFVGAAYEDLGVVTEPDARGRGLSAACAAALCDDVRARGHTPSWTTTPDNTGSLRVAAKVGFVQDRLDRMYVVGIPIPEPPAAPGG
jgi:RimJ/RimL family protein N-acetyltransferase